MKYQIPVHPTNSFLLAFCALLLTGFSLFSQTKTTILSTGPISNRLNLTLLSEGYRDVEAARFLADATNLVNFFLAAEPYREYRSYFNAAAIFVASPESGSDHPAYPLKKDTYFNGTYDLGERFITIPLHKNGKGKVDALIRALAPENNLTILVVNDLAFGGGGGPILIVSRNVASPEIVVHESGHTLADLGDEYNDPFPSYPNIEQPNTTRQTNRNSIKWKAWISPMTPVPTPQTFAYENEVGLFQGAHYQSNGWYRPKLDCRMRTLGYPFCEICSEALVKAICKRVRLAESFSPAKTNISLATPQLLDFQISTLQPAGHNLTVQWFTNGVPINGSTNPNFQLVTLPLPRGTYLVRAEIRDPTLLVRTDPENFLRNSVTWRISKSFSPPGPFESVKGTYEGLFFETNEVRLASSGLFTLTLSASGAFSGKLLMPDGTRSFNGQFDPANRAQIMIRRSRKTDLTMSLEMDLAEQKIGGTVSDPNWVAEIKANRDAASASAARYTFVLPGQDGALTPAGDSYGSGVLGSDGSLRLSGMLSDGTGLSFSAKKSSNGEYPLFIRLYGGKGMLLSWLGLSDELIDGSSVAWIKETGVGGKFYPAGFTNATLFSGERYTPPPSGQPVLVLTNAMLVLERGNLNPAITNESVITNNGFAFTGTNHVSLAIVPATGLWKGKFLHPATRKMTDIQGAVLQRRRTAHGLFLGVNESGRITLQERAE